MMPQLQTDRNFVALRTANEVYMFFYGDEDTEAVIRTIARFAADPELSFNWTDAATLIRDVLAIGVRGSHAAS